MKDCCCCKKCCARYKRPAKTSPYMSDWAIPMTYSDLHGSVLLTNTDGDIIGISY